MKKEETRNSKILRDFIKYCQEHENERWWQCVRNFSGFAYVCVSNKFSSGTDIRDTFHWENLYD
jgi:hypothetical protein